MYTCSFCGKKNKCVGVVRNETHYYSVRIETGQWKDCGEGAELGKYYCLSCNKTNDNDFK